MQESSSIEMARPITSVGPRPGRKQSVGSRVNTGKDAAGNESAPFLTSWTSQELNRIDMHFVVMIENVTENETYFLKENITNLKTFPWE